MLTDGVSYQPDPNRYDGRMIYRRVGHWGLQLPAISLGLWKNFGDAQPFETQRAVVRAAFDAGVTHFDLANNYGPPYGQAEINFGTLLRTDLAPYRDELVISTKAGYDMWPGPYGQGGGSRKYIRASLDQSLARLRLDYVDIFYSHRFDPETPLEETMMALDRAVRSGKALYAAISNYPAAETAQAAQIARELGTPLLIHQARYSIFNRWVEGGGDGAARESLLDRAEAEGMGVMAFSPLQQGLLTSRYLQGVPDDSRARHSSDFRQSWLDEDTLAQVRALNDIAAARGQSLAQMALAWLLRDERVSSVVIGASSVKQLTNSLGALKNLYFTAEELAAIDAHGARPGHELWSD
ncbi:Oxidoreductase [Propionibacterium freudenreichii]|uniref:aldo/keto reductase n=1 Tax=Propionibacterium freudenreichii TaxID=1744 RepID=UPI000541F5EE|nr:Oxidoreductase [Propionibacterium freudenreichii]